MQASFSLQQNIDNIRDPLAQLQAECFETDFGILCKAAEASFEKLPEFQEEGMAEIHYLKGIYISFKQNVKMGRSRANSSLSN